MASLVDVTVVVKKVLVSMQYQKVVAVDVVGGHSTAVWRARGKVEAGVH